MERAAPTTGPRGAPHWLRRSAPWLAFAASLAATAALVAVRGEDLAVLEALDPGAALLLVALQAVYLVVQSGRFHTRFAAAFVNAPWVAMVLNFVLGAAVVALAQPGARVGGWSLAWLLALAAGVTAAAPLGAALLLPLFPRRFRLLAWLHGRLAEMVAVTLGSLRDAGYLLRVVAWTLAAFVQATAMLWVGFVALGSDVGLAQAVAFYVLLQLATYLPLTPGNLGVQELAFGVLAAGLGSAAVDGVVVSALVRVTGVVALVALALPLGGVQALRESRAVPAATAS